MIDLNDVRNLPSGFSRTDLGDSCPHYELKLPETDRVTGNYDLKFEISKGLVGVSFDQLGYPYSNYHFSVHTTSQYEADRDRRVSGVDTRPNIYSCPYLYLGNASDVDGEMEFHIYLSTPMRIIDDTGPNITLRIHSQSTVEYCGDCDWDEGDFDVLQRNSISSAAMIIIDKPTEEQSTTIPTGEGRQFNYVLGRQFMTDSWVKPDHLMVTNFSDEACRLPVNLSTVKAPMFYGIRYLRSKITLDDGVRYFMNPAGIEVMNFSNIEDVDRRYILHTAVANRDLSACLMGTEIRDIDIRHPMTYEVWPCEKQRALQSAFTVEALETNPRDAIEAKLFQFSSELDQFSGPQLVRPSNNDQKYFIKGGTKQRGIGDLLLSESKTQDISLNNLGAIYPRGSDSQLQKYITKSRDENNIVELSKHLLEMWRSQIYKEELEV